MSSINGNIKIEKGDTLICKRRGIVEVTAVNEDGFFVKYKGIEYYHPYTDIGKMLKTIDTQEKEKENNKNIFKLRNYKECVAYKNKLEKDPIYKEEAIQLAKITNIIGTKLNNLIIKEKQIDRKTRWTYSPTPAEREAWVFNKGEGRRILKEIDGLKVTIKKPYFARVDIKSEKNEIIKIYVGENGVTQNSEDIVYDWRSILGQRYYKRNELEFELSGISYNTELIRNIDIKNSLLWEYEDDYLRNNEDVAKSVADPFLVKILREKRNTKGISNIISSIQENQNNIITRNINDNIIVQGCAGSGKTMILLHRLSYLMYNNSLDLAKIKIITPNNIFKSSINNLAKELQIDEIEKLCIEEYFFSKIEEYGLRLKGKIVTTNIHQEMYKYIYSEEFKKVLKSTYNDYIEYLWNIFDNNQFDRISTRYQIQDTRSEMQNRDYKNLQYCIRRIKEEFLKKEKEYISKQEECKLLKNKFLEIEKTIDLVKQKKEFLDDLSINISQLNNIEEKELEQQRLETDINRLASVLNIKVDINIDEIKTMIDQSKDEEEMYKSLSKKINFVSKTKEDLEEIISLKLEQKEQSIFSIRKKREIKEKLFNLFNKMNMNPTVDINVINEKISDVVKKLTSLNSELKTYEGKLEKVEMLKDFEFLKEELSLIQNLESRKSELKHIILEKAKTLNLEEVNSEKIEKEKENIGKIIQDYDEKRLDIDSKEKLLQAFKQENFLGIDLKDIKREIEKIVKLTDNDLSFIETKIYNPLIHEISKSFGFKNYKQNNRIKLFCLLNLLFIHKGIINRNDKMIYFDEGQDINYYEYNLIKNINGDKVIFNIFGDVNQLTDKLRGIDDWSKLSNISDFKTFMIQENYRNSQNITNYCIKSTGYNMTPVGVDDGQVVEVYESDKEVKRVIETFVNDSSARKVVIVKELDQEARIFLGNGFKGQSLNIISEVNNILKLDKINVLTVSMAKGMEFDSTLVLANKMNNNELYIALTRALINNYIILS